MTSLLRPLALLLALAASGCAGARASSQASDFTLPSVDGTPLTLSEHLGKKVILLNFWATWCQPCAHELPHLQALWDKYQGKDLLILGVAMDGPESVANVAPFVRRSHLSFPVLLDEETRAVSLYNPHRSAPFNVLIDRSGAVAKTFEGFNPGDEVELEKALAALLEPAAPAAPAAAAP